MAAAAVVGALEVQISAPEGETAVAAELEATSSVAAPGRPFCFDAFAGISVPVVPGCGAVVPRSSASGAVICCGGDFGGYYA